MDPTTHILLSRGQSEDESGRDVITLDEWRAAVAMFPNFTISDQMKQQNPFTKEFLLIDSPGSGYWVPPTLAGPVWSDDGRVWFRFANGMARFVQFSNLNDPDLVALAHELDATIEHDRIGP